MENISTILISTVGIEQGAMKGEDCTIWMLMKNTVMEDPSY